MLSVLLIGSLGPFEIILILLAILLLFGAKRLPELAKGMGKAKKEFEKASKDIKDDIEKVVESGDDTPKKDKE